MTYIAKQKITIITSSRPPLRVLVAQLDPILNRLYIRHLEKDFEVSPSLSHSRLENDILVFAPNLVLLNADTPGVFPHTLARLRSMFASLPIITTGLDTSEEQLGLLMAAGVAGHINRKFTHPRDISTIVAQTLKVTR